MIIRSLTCCNKTVLDAMIDSTSLGFINDLTSEPKGFELYNYQDSCNWAVSEKYLQQRMVNDQLPNLEYRYNYVFAETPGASFLIKTLAPLLHFEQVHTAGYYPFGFTGWHADRHLQGWNIMMSYSPTAQGFFRYLNSDGNIVTKYDTPGWNIFYSKIEQHSWHCAQADSARFTFLLYFSNQDSCENAVNFIEN